MLVPPPQPENWRDGVVTTPIVTALQGATSICVFEQMVLPGAGAPLHWHETEEVLMLIEGEAEVSVGDQLIVVSAPASILVPPGTTHAFKNVGPGVLRVRAVLASSWFEARYVKEKVTVVRWKPDAGRS